MKGARKEQDKERRRKRREKLGTRKKERLTKTESERVNQLVETREKRKEENRERSNSIELEVRKWVDVLNGCEQGYSYERWEARSLWRKCMKEGDGYRVKANQKGRRDWSKERVEAYEFDLRNWRSKENERERSPSQSETKEVDRKRLDVESQVVEVKEERGGEEWGFWKYYEKKDAERVTVWKKGILYKKGMRKNEMTSWDRATYRKEKYEKRRTIKLQRRYVRDAEKRRSRGVLSSNEESNQKGSGRNLVRELKNGKKESTMDSERKRSKERNPERRKRTYDTFQNPEERRRSSGWTKKTKESHFQSRLRNQTMVEIKMKDLEAKPFMRMDQSGKDSRVEKGKKRSVWSSQLRRIWYNQMRWKRNEKAKEKN